MKDRKILQSEVDNPTTPSECSTSSTVATVTGRSEVSSSISKIEN